MIQSLAIYSTIKYNYLGKEETSGKEIPLGERVVFDLISGHNFQGKHLYFDNFFTSLRLLENLKLQDKKLVESSDQIGQVSRWILLRRIECNEAIVSQLLHRIALSSYGWTLNTFFWLLIIIKITKLFRYSVGCKTVNVPRLPVRQQ